VRRVRVVSGEEENGYLVMGEVGGRKDGALGEPRKVRKWWEELMEKGREWKEHGEGSQAHTTTKQQTEGTERSNK